MSILKLIETIKKQLEIVCKTKHEAEQQAIWMIEELTQKKYAQLILNPNIQLTNKQNNILTKWIEERVKYSKPIQYIFGYLEFLNLKLKVKNPILIPRPETEEWVDIVIKILNSIDQTKSNITILDIGTGSGCIALSLAKNLPNSIVTGIDINPKAIKLAKENKALNEIENAFFLISDFYANLKNQKFDIIISNPPYISEKEWKNLDKVVKNWEDKNALVAKKSYLFAYKTIIKKAKYYLKEKKNIKDLLFPNLFLEIGKGQEKEIKFLLKKNEFKNIKYYKDLNKIIRMISAKQ